MSGVWRTQTFLKTLFLWFFLSLTLGNFLFIGCAQVPLTNRRALNIVSDSELTQLGITQYQKILRKAKICTDREKVEMVERVGRKIAFHAEKFLEEVGLGHKIRYFKWEFTLFEDDKQANAWCLPGGKVGVFTGILKYTQNEAGLAVVLGHEIAHAIAGHGNERMSQAILAQLGGMALSSAIASKPEATRELFAQVYGIAASVGVILPYSRLQEEEADRIGLVLMAKAGYDPREAILFWERMQKDSMNRPKPPEFLSTHPLPESRIAYIRSYIPEALSYFKQSSTN